jgi:nicotinate-nucleotide adenylyltransferase
MTGAAPGNTGEREAGTSDVVRGRPPRVGWLGGTFDPIHIGHLMAAEEARSNLSLDRVLFVPAATPPHKLGVTMSAADHRLAMVELAIADHPGFEASRIDLDRDGPHFTVHLLRLARAELGLDPTETTWFVMGGDSLVDLPTWRDPTGIIAEARLAVISRPGYEPDLTGVARHVPGLAARVDLVEMPLIGVSGTDIRRRVPEGRSIRYHVPAAVESYVHEHGLYRSP